MTDLISSTRCAGVVVVPRRALGLTLIGAVVSEGGEASR